MILRLTAIIVLAIALAATPLGNFWFSQWLLFQPGIAHAGSTGDLTTTTITAVTSGAGDNNGFETTYGTANPKDTTTKNAAGVESLNSGTAASTNCALPNTSSDQADWSNFGISLPSGAVTTGIMVTVRAHYDSSSGTNRLCFFLSGDGGASWTAGQATGDINTSTTADFTVGSQTNLWGQSGWTASQLNNTNFRLRIMTLVANTSRDAFIDYVGVNVSYNEPPSAPSQDLPLNGATGVSTLPTFLSTATDPDADNLGYKVTIYSDNACSMVVQTDDQSVSPAGWSGMDAACTNAPTSCYASGTQSNYTVQTSLSSGTQYWWRASAKDPDGTGAFTDSATCNSFTTAAAASITLTLSSSTVSLGGLTPGIGVPSSATTTAAVSMTGGTNGYNLSLQADSATSTMASGATGFPDLNPRWDPAASGNAVAVPGQTFSFRVQSSGTTSNYSATWWGGNDSDGTAQYAGFATTSQQIMNCTTCNAGSTDTTVKYRADAPSSQATGAYTGQITYTALTNP